MHPFNTFLHRNTHKTPLILTYYSCLHSETNKNTAYIYIYIPTTGLNSETRNQQKHYIYIGHQPTAQEGTIISLISLFIDAY